MKPETRIKIFRDEHQFAAAHFLVGMGKCERLHGHNYSVTVELVGEPGPDNTLVDFNSLNPLVAAMCEKLDHKVILAAKDPRFELRVKDGEVEARFENKRYVFPEEDCAILDIVATTVEKLAAYLLDSLAGDLAQRENIHWIEIGVREGFAQMAYARRPLR